MLANAPQIRQARLLFARGRPGCYEEESALIYQRIGRLRTLHLLNVCTLQYGGNGEGPQKYYGPDWKVTLLSQTHFTRAAVIEDPPILAAEGEHFLQTRTGEGTDSCAAPAQEPQQRPRVRDRTHGIEASTWGGSS